MQLEWYFLISNCQTWELTNYLTFLENITLKIDNILKTLEGIEEELFYLKSKGLDEDQAKELIIMGFIQDFKKELPMEYAVELNRLLKN